MYGEVLRPTPAFVRFWKKKPLLNSGVSGEASIIHEKPEKEPLLRMEHLSTPFFVPYVPMYTYSCDTHNAITNFIVNPDLTVCQ